MRKIKFRGKEISRKTGKSTNQWRYGYYTAVNGKDHFIQTGVIEVYLVDPGSVGQLLGHLGSGEEVYEDDLILHGETVRKIEVISGNTCARTLAGDRAMLLCLCNNPKVVGNIHDNPDLIPEQ